MLASFSIVPIGVGEELREHIAGVLEIVEKSGLDYKLGAMATTVEGGRDEVMTLIMKCHEHMMARAPRVLTRVSIDDRKNATGRLTGKVKDVESPGTDSRRDGDLIKGLGFRGGAGLLVKPIKWISVGATCEVAGTYFREENDTTWGYAVDVTAHFAVHI